jgi:hypothetical protein
MTHPPSGPYPPQGEEPGDVPYGQPRYGPPRYGQPQYGHSHYGPTAPKSRRGLWIGLALGGIALVLCCAGGGVVAYVGYRASTPEAAAAAWFDAVRAEDVDAAYDLLCAADRAARTREEVRADGLGPPFARYTVHGSERRTLSNGQVRALVDVELVDEGGDTSAARLPLVEEDDGWKVCGLS